MEHFNFDKCLNIIVFFNIFLVIFSNFNYSARLNSWKSTWSTPVPRTSGDIAPHLLRHMFPRPPAPHPHRPARRRHCRHCRRGHHHHLMKPKWRKVRRKRKRRRSRRICQAKSFDASSSSHKKNVIFFPNMISNSGIDNIIFKRRYLFLQFFSIEVLQFLCPTLTLKFNF